MAANPPQKLSVRVLCISASGLGADAHPMLRAGKVTVIAAVNSQARVSTAVPIVLAGAEVSPSAPGQPVSFDRFKPGDSLSLTAGSLGAASVPIDAIGSEPSVQDFPLSAAGSVGAAVHFSLRLLVSRAGGVAAAPATAVAAPSATKAPVPAARNVATGSATVAVDKTASASPQPVPLVGPPSAAAPALAPALSTTAAFSIAARREARAAAAAASASATPAVETVVLLSAATPPRAAQQQAAPVSSPAPAGPAASAAAAPGRTNAGTPPTLATAAAPGSGSGGMVGGRATWGGSSDAAAAATQPPGGITGGRSGRAGGSGTPSGNATVSSPSVGGSAPSAPITSPTITAATTGAARRGGSGAPALAPQAATAASPAGVRRDAASLQRRLDELLSHSAAIDPTAASAAVGTPLLPRLVDYFAVMVSVEVELPPGVSPESLERGLGPPRRRTPRARRRRVASGAVGGRRGAGTTGGGTAPGTKSTGPAESSPFSDEEGEEGEEDDGDIDDEEEEGEDGGYADGDGSGRGVLRRVGKLQYRYPKKDHPDCPMPEAVDWFLFPSGIAPIAQPAGKKSRPPIRKSSFVLSNVGGGALNSKMYGCCLTAYMQEADADAEEDDDGDYGAGGGSGRTALWWPVVLFFLSRYPLVPQLSRILHHVYDVYDGGVSTGAALGAPPPPSYCSLQEYLRMLVFETPVPVRRAGMGVQVFLPGPQPRVRCPNSPSDTDVAGNGAGGGAGGAWDAVGETDTRTPGAVPSGVCNLYLPPPDALPHLQFDASLLLRRFPPRSLLGALASLSLERRIVVVADRVDTLVSTCESLLGLLYPLQFDFPYIPVLPAHLAGDCIANPVPFLYGLLSSAALRAFGEVTRDDIRDLVIIDVEEGRVEAGAGAFLRRMRGEADADDDVEGDSDPTAAPQQAPKRGPYDEEVEEEEDEDGGSGGGAHGVLPQFPEPLFSEAISEMTELQAQLRTAAVGKRRAAAEAQRVTGTSSGRAPPPSPTPQGGAPGPLSPSQRLQGLCLRVFGTLLAGYRSAALFSGTPPQFAPIFSAEAWVETRAAGLGTGAHGATVEESRAAGREFLLALTQTQMFSGLLQRHAALSLRPFHSLCALIAQKQQATSSQMGIYPQPQQSRASSQTTPSSLRLGDSVHWVPPAPPPAQVLVVPPPGFGPASTLLSAWQPQQEDGARLLPSVAATGPGGTLAPRPGPGGKPPKKSAKDKRTDAEAARHWTSGEVATALHLSPTASAELELLCASSSRGNNGTHGDDVGAVQEGADDAAAETAALLASAAEAAGPESNPVLGPRVSDAAGGGQTASPASARPLSSRQRLGDFLRRRTLRRRKAAAVTAEGEEEEEGGSGGVEPSGPVDRVYSWLASLLLVQQKQQPATSSAGTAAADEALCAALASRPARAAFVRVLQCQSLLGAGLSTPLSGALGTAGHGALAQLQPLLGLGVTPWPLSLPPVTGTLTPSAAASGAGAAAAASPAAGNALALAVASLSAASAGVDGAPSPSSLPTPSPQSSLPFRDPNGLALARVLLAVTLRPALFLRLTRACGRLLEWCQGDSDFVSAAALLQVGFFIYPASSLAEGSGGGVGGSRGRGVAPYAPQAPPASLSTLLLGAGPSHSPPTASIAGLSSPRAPAPSPPSSLWRDAGFWEAYVAQAVAVEDQQSRLLQLPLRIPALLAAEISATAKSALAPPAAPRRGGGGGAAGRWPDTPAVTALLRSLLPHMLRAGLGMDACEAFLVSAGGRNGLVGTEVAALQTFLEELPEEAEGDAGQRGAAAVLHGPGSSSPPAAAAAEAALVAAAPLARDASKRAAAVAPTARGATATAPSSSGGAGGTGGPAGVKAAIPTAAGAAPPAVAVGAADATVPQDRPLPPAAAAKSLTKTAGARAKAAAAAAVAAAAALVPSGEGALSSGGTGGQAAPPTAPPAAAAAEGTTPTTAAAEPAALPPGSAAKSSTAPGGTSAHDATGPAPPPGAPLPPRPSPPSAPHPWAAFPAVIAEAYARDLVATRRNPPAPDPAIVALMSGKVGVPGAAAAAAASKGKVPGAADSTIVAATGLSQGATATTASPPSTSHSYLLQPAPAAGGTIAPMSQHTAGGAAPPAPGTEDAAGAATAPLSQPGKRPPRTAVIRKWGKATGLSMLASTFSASLPPDAMQEVLAQAAAVAAAAAAVGTPPSAPSSAPPAPASNPPSHGSGPAPPGSSAWTTVDVGNMGLLDAVLHTLQSSHDAARKAAVEVAAAAVMDRGRGQGAGGTRRLGAGAADSEAEEAAAAAAGLGAITAVQMSCLAFRGHAPGAAITCLSHDPEDGRAVTGGNDGRLTLWDMHQRSYVHTYEDHGAAITAVALCGDVVVSASQDATVRLSSFARLHYFGGEGPGMGAPAAGEAPPQQSGPKGPAPRGSGAPGVGASATGGSGGSGSAPFERDEEEAEEEDADFSHDGGDGSGDVHEEYHSQTPSTPSRTGAGGFFTADASGGGSGTAPGSAPSTPTSFMATLGLHLPSRLPGRRPQQQQQAAVAGSASRPGGGGAPPSRPQQRFESAVRLKGHSGPVTAVDAWLKPEEPKKDWLGRPVRPALDPETGAPLPAPRTLPSTSQYIIATGGADGTVRTWGARWRVNKRGAASGSGVHISTQTGLHKGGAAVECVKLSSDGRLAVSAARDGRIGITDVASSKTWVMAMAPPAPASPAGGRGGLWGGGWGRGGGGAGTGGGAGSPGGLDPLWLPTGLPLVSCSIDASPRRPVTILSAGVDGTVRCWDLRAGTIAVGFASGSPVWAFGCVPAHGGGAPVLDADGSPVSPGSPLGDAYLLSTHEDGLVRKWDARLPSVPLAVWAGHRGAVTSLCVERGADRVVTGGVDGTVRLWDAATGLSLGCEGHSGPVAPGCGVSMGEDYMLSASWDGSLRCWFPAT